jgi:outer membrane murein-binding lipoprotein Lpp
LTPVAHLPENPGGRKSHTISQGDSNMQFVIRLGLVVLSAGLLAGCAAKSDVAAIQTQIDGLKAEQASIRGTAEQALAAAQAASGKAGSAEAEANRATVAAQAASAKLDQILAKGAHGRHGVHSHQHGKSTHSHPHSGHHHH